MIWQSFKRIARLIFVSFFTGFSFAWLEIYIGQRHILDKILLGRDPSFVYEYFWAPNYYGFAKFLAVTLAFLLTYTLLPEIKLKPLLIGFMETVALGIDYYLISPNIYLFSSVVIGLVHFIFITAMATVISLIFDYKWRSWQKFNGCYYSSIKVASKATYFLRVFANYESLRIYEFAIFASIR